MGKIQTGLLCTAVLLFLGLSTSAEDVNRPDAVTGPVEIARYKKENSSARLEPAKMDGKNGIAVVFTGTSDLHYYAKSRTATAPGFQLEVEAESRELLLGKAIFPTWKIFNDPVGTKVEVYAGDFAVFVPIEKIKDNNATVKVKIEGQACTSNICLAPFTKLLQATVDCSQASTWRRIIFEKAASSGTSAKVPDFALSFALVLSFLAGLSLNIMPCVWPVLPLIIMRIVNQAKAGRRQAFSMGIAFCAGILLFFACLAGANIVLKSLYGTTLGWGEYMRRPVVAGGLALLMVVMALFMFGVFTITVPSAVANKSGSGKGYAGSVGMGFLAAILSTPCSFAILTTAFVWAQGQSLPLGTLAIMVIGVGMAVPYAILTLMPGVLRRLPRGGRWMELFKEAIGFILLVIALKLIKGLPADGKANVLYFAVVLSFCIWMWGGWVTFDMKLPRKILIRSAALIIVILTAMMLFEPQRIQWQSYDAQLIEKAREEHRPVLIDFTASWCANCSIVDKVVYQRRDIAGLFEEKNILAIKADTTLEDSAATAALKNVYKEPAIPVSLLFLPDQNEPGRFAGEIFFAGKLKGILEKLPSRRYDNGKKGDRQEH